jgi:hypothetical protein
VSKAFETPLLEVDKPPIDFDAPPLAPAQPTLDHERPPLESAESPLALVPFSLEAAPHLLDRATPPSDAEQPLLERIGRERNIKLPSPVDSDGRAVSPEMRSPVPCERR